MFAFLAARIAPLLLKMTPFGQMLKRVPAWAWYALAVVALLAAATLYHHHKVKAHDHALIAARDAYWNTRLAAVAKQARDLRDKAEAASAAISSDVRNKNAQANRDIAVAADALRVSGPGQARCRPVDYSGVSVGSGRSVAASGAGNSVGLALPPDDRAAVPQAVVPWGWLVDSAEQADLNRQEALAWREWYQRQVAAWPKPAKP